VFTGHFAKTARVFWQRGFYLYGVRTKSKDVNSQEITKHCKELDGSLPC